MLAGPINPNPFPPCGFSQRPITKGKEGWIVARIRTIKPDFFTSADIVALTPLSRLFYVSTWCEADREGRLVWHLPTLKLRYFPAEQCDISEIARQVVDVGLIEVYEVDGKQYAEIPSFSNHQTINNREAESFLPPNPSKQRKEGRKGSFPASARVKDASKETPLPDDFSISDSVREWAESHGYSRLEERLCHFKDYALAKGVKYKDWDAAFRNAIKGDWAKLAPAKPMRPKSEQWMELVA